MTTEVYDPYNSKQLWNKVKDDFQLNTKTNQVMVEKFLKDMELGINVGSKKGKRSYTRLVTLRNRLKKLDELFNKEFTKLTAEDVAKLFNDMREGNIRKSNGKPYQSTADYVKVFKSFWHWFMKVSRKKGRVIEDIVTDISSEYDKKPQFTYFTYKDSKLLSANSKLEYKVMFDFMFDSGIRTGKELSNVKAKHITTNNNGIVELQIIDEASKTFGRKIKLLLCGKQIKNYIEIKGLKPEDYIFDYKMSTVNRYLNRLGKKVLGKPITMYDFRHNSCCYWLPRYKSENALKYRFGWKKAEMISYYSEYLGMKDTICQDDLIDSDDRTQLQKELEKQKQQNEIIEEQLKAQQQQMNELLTQKEQYKEAFKNSLMEEIMQKLANK